MKLTIVGVFAISLGLCGWASGSGQLVQIGPTDSRYCEKEPVKPNLDLLAAVEVRGRIHDASGAPFRNVRIEVRRFVSADEASHHG